MNFEYKHSCWFIFNASFNLILQTPHIKTCEVDMQARKFERLLDRDEVEQTFGIPKRFLERSVCNNSGPKFVKIGRMVKYRPSDIERWIEINTRGPTI